jgi:hypothetical protein
MGGAEESKKQKEGEIDMFVVLHIHHGKFLVPTVAATPRHQE